MAESEQSHQRREEEMASDTSPAKWDVDRYQQQHSFVWKYGAASLLDIIFAEEEQEHNNSDHLTILDVGCGTGELTHQIWNKQKQQQQHECTILGLDADPDMIAQAKAQFSPNVTFLVGNVAKGGLEQYLAEQSVDVIVSNAALHWIAAPDNDIYRAVQSMAWVLKPGGRFIVEFGGKGNIESIVQACQQVLKEKKDIDCPCPWYFPSISEFTNVVEQHGIIEVTSAELFDRPTVLEEGDDGMKNWIRMFGRHFLDYLDDDDNDEIDMFLAAMNAKLRPKLYDGTQWTADYRRIRVVGRRKKLP